MMVNGDHGSVALLYGEVEDTLARLHNVQDKDRKAFRAKLRHFRNLGIPPLPKVGSGTKISYSLDDLYELFFALELTQCGLSPSTIEHLNGHFRQKLPKMFGYALAAPKDEVWLPCSERPESTVQRTKSDAVVHSASDVRFQGLSGRNREASN